MAASDAVTESIFDFDLLNHRIGYTRRGWPADHDSWSFNGRTPQGVWPSIFPRQCLTGFGQFSEAEP
jgi:hypothetical protein